MRKVLKLGYWILKAMFLAYCTAFLTLLPFVCYNSNQSSGSGAVYFLFVFFISHLLTLVAPKELNKILRPISNMKIFTVVLFSYFIFFIPTFYSFDETFINTSNDLWLSLVGFISFFIFLILRLLIEKERSKKL